MAKKRRRWTPDEIRPIVERWLDAPNRREFQLAEGFANNTLLGWAKKLGIYRRPGGMAGPAPTAAPPKAAGDTVAKLRAQIADLKLENTVLRANLSLAIRRGFLDLFTHERSANAEAGKNGASRILGHVRLQQTPGIPPS